MCDLNGCNKKPETSRRSFCGIIAKKGSCANINNRNKIAIANKANQTCLVSRNSGDVARQAAKDKANRDLGYEDRESHQGWLNE